MNGLTVAVVLCAGQGTRLGAGMNKVFVPIHGKPLLAHTLDVFQRAAAVDEVIVVAHPAEVDRCRTEVVAPWALTKVRAVIAGGATRHLSEWQALTHLQPRIRSEAVAQVLMHDGARPLVAAADLMALLDALRWVPGAILVDLAASGELLATDGEVLRPLPTGGQLGRAHTPQAFLARVLLDAYERANDDGFEGTDTAASLERLGLPVAAVVSSMPNLKVTTPDDLVRAEVLLGE
jgi:2-C-methyl-D-erythritol 4-phosphate cytidylyltransferase